MRLLSTSSVLSFLALTSFCAAANSTSTDHYHAGPVDAVFSQLNLVEDGAVVLGEDGVLRSFDGKGVVVDYAQLDPGQISAFAHSQLDVWDRSDKETPESVINLAKAEGVDGRSVTDISALLHPAGAPVFPQSKKARQPLKQRQEACLSEPCTTSAECQVDGCVTCVKYISGTKGYCMGGIIT